MPEAMYVCESAPGLKIKIRGELKQFENKKMTLSDQRDIDFMDEQLATNTHVSSLIRKIDMKAAEEIARAHMAQQQPAATKGSVTSEVERAQLDAIKDDDRVNLDDPAVAQAHKEIIENDSNVAETEKPNLENTAAEQEAKIKAAQEAAAANSGVEKPAGEEPGEQENDKTFNILGNKN